MTDTLFGIDISYAQGAMTAAHFASFVADGMTFCVQKATIGTKVDSTFKARMPLLEASDLVVGVYAFIVPSSLVSAAKQADLFLDTVGDIDGKLVMLDIEHDGGAYPTAADVKAWVARFREREPSHPILLYFPRWYWSRIGRPGSLSGLGLLWGSAYVTPSANPPDPWRQLWAKATDIGWAPYGGWDEVTIRQFTSSGEVGTFPKRLDVNAFRGSLDDLLALTRSNEDQPMLITDVKPFTGKVTLTKPWRAWDPATGKQTAEIAAGAVFRPFATGAYNDGKPAFLITNNNRLLLLPAGAIVGLTVEPSDLIYTQAQVDTIVGTATAALNSKIEAARSHLLELSTALSD